GSLLHARILGSPADTVVGLQQMGERAGVAASRNCSRGPSLDNQYRVRIRPSVYLLVLILLRLDALGVACFNHNFDALSGNYNVVIAAFFALRLPADWLFTQALKHPWLLRIPSAKHKVLKNFEGYVDRMADDILNGYEKQD
ncbi:unnamed protein product, partial [Mycena citricolor]